MKNKEPGLFPPKVIKETVSFDDNKHSVTPETLHSGGGMSENRITDPRTRKLAGLPALKEGANLRLLQQVLKTALMNLSRRGLTLPEIKSMVQQTLMEIEPLVVTASPEDTMDLAAGQRDQ